MTLTKERAELIDNFLIALRDHKEPTLYLDNYKATHSSVAGIETLPKLMQMVYSYQVKNHLSLIQINGEGVDQLKDLDWFVDSNGFTAIWEQQEKDRQFQDDVKTVNDSVKKTNAATQKNFSTQFFISIATIFIALLAAFISWLAYQNSKISNETEQRLKTLETSTTKMQEQIKQEKQLTVADTVHSIIVIDTIK